MANDLFDLTGQIALVTGSSQGIGHALAKGLADAGAAVILNGRDTEKLGRAAAELRQEGHTAHEMPFDVTDQNAVTSAIQKIENEIGPIGVLVNNTGMQFRTPLEDFPADKWHALMRTNVDSVFFVGQSVARFMIERGEGKIINICSVQSELGRTGIAPYTATKGAIKMLTKGMCTDWAKHGLQINAIGPGYFKTPLNQALVDDPNFTEWLENRTPAGRWGDVEELVGAAVFLSSKASSFVNGHVLYVDGGITSSL
ncbi:MAG: SDR family oxidoreductase [Pseudomonadota bacterium]